jgi:hypothetical protein
MADDLQAVLRDGVQKGFTEIGFQRCLELMARMDSGAHREAWFDIFYDRWATISIVPSTLSRSYKSMLYQRILTIRGSQVQAVSPHLNRPCFPLQCTSTRFRIRP